eukprot:TRINITY_DN13172_c1_g1_i1.p1 TRINITY_DN13172_c1_g1~~TRINITY_DN13172_c1_g1_i1.p1  ORF type:complete len:1242 (-),score=216.78 TRINITY_DN13172_c1_g1_i1:42-3767(-)
MRAAVVALVLGTQNCLADFCRAYAPLEGSRFTFPEKRCLAQDFMDAEFAKGSFGNEPIRLATELRNLSYQLDGGGVLSFPLALEASWGWESGHTVTAVIDILLREVLGIDTEFVCTWGSSHGLRLLGGCSSPMGSDRCTKDDGQPQLTLPLAQASVETWVTTAQEYKDMLLHGSNLGMVGYQSKSGLFFDATIAEDAFRKDFLSLEWWQVYTTKYASTYFDTYQAISASVKNFSKGATEPSCIPGTAAYTTMQERGYSCVDGWFFAPSCENDKDSCIPVILAEFSWNALAWVEAAIDHGYHFAITWIGAQYSFTFGMRSGNRVLFYCPTVTAVCSEKPLAKLFGDEHAPQGRPDYITGLQKVVWRRLRQVDEQVYDLIQRINFPTEDFTALMEVYSLKLGLAPSTGQALDELIQEVACEWIRNSIRVKDTRGEDTGDNTKKWALWIPRTCRPGQAYDDALGFCRNCSAGENSPDGMKCVPCVQGTFADEAGTARCKACSLGFWQDGSDRSRCSECARGQQRDMKDWGCQECGPGFFASEPGRATCKMCSLGSYSSARGSSECVLCPAGMMTPREASTEEADCECAPGEYYPCGPEAACNLTIKTECKTCPEGFACPGGKEVMDGRVRYKQPLVNAGFYARRAKPYEAFKCAEAGEFCPGGKVETCSGGRSGLQCHACNAGFRSGSGDPCEVCELSSFLIFPAVIIAGFLLLALAYRMTNGSRSKLVSKVPLFGYISLVSTYTQLVALQISLDVDWPPSFKALLVFLQMFMLDVKLLATSCYAGGHHLAIKYMPGLIIPINIACMLLLMWGVSHAMARVSSRVSPMQLDQVMNTFGTVLSGLYVAIIKSTLSIFEARSNPSAPPTLRSYDGFYYLGEEMLSLIPAAALGILAYIVGVASLFVWVVLRAPALHQQSSTFKIRFAFLLKRWHPSCWYWGIFFLMRNVLCSLVPSITSDGVLQLLMLIAVIVSSMLAQVRLWPWRESLSNNMDCMFSTALLVILVMGLAIKSPSTSNAVQQVIAATNLLSYFLAVTATFLIVLKVAVSHVFGSFTAKPEQAESVTGATVPTADAVPSADAVAKDMPSENSEGSWSFLVDGARKVADRLQRSEKNASKQVAKRIFQILMGLQAKFTLVGPGCNRGKEDLIEILQTLAEELPERDLQNLQWTLGTLGYHALGDSTLRPPGIVMSPIIQRRDVVPGHGREVECSCEGVANGTLQATAGKLETVVEAESDNDRIRDVQC